MTRPLSLHRLFVLLLICLAVLVGMSTLLTWQHNFRQQQDGLRESRFQFSLIHVKASLESGLRLGFAVSELPGAQNLIDQVRARQSDILSIDIFNTQGLILFSTDPAGQGSSVPLTWRKPCMQSAGQLWVGQTQDSDLQCTAVVNGFEQVSGGVLLRYRLPSRSTRAVELPHAWPWLLAGLVLLVSALAAWSRTASTALDREAQALHDTLSDETPWPANEMGAAWGPVTEALEALARFQHGLSEADAEAERLDKLEGSS
jgi:hypothetical protein